MIVCKYNKCGFRIKKTGVCTANSCLSRKCEIAEKPYNEYMNLCLKPSSILN